jgi:imidazole glycerol-phosphate synthase subunit HisH
MIVIIDYGFGNPKSVANMLRRVGAEVEISRDPEVVERADKLVLSGVGAFDAGMAQLEGTGLLPLLRSRVLDDRVPIIGLCLGMQLLTESSEEGRAPGLGWIPGRTVRFRFAGREPEPRIPHMGWNTVRIARPNAVLAAEPGDESAPRFYFAHSFHVVCDEPYVAGWTEYGYEFPAVIGSGHIWGTQFHPEKSHRFGMRLLRNFAERA